MNLWYVYIVRCADDTLYAGIAKDVARRINEHNSDNRLGAKYTKSRRPVQLVYTESCTSRSEATRREAEIKKMRKSRKEKLFQTVG